MQKGNNHKVIVKSFFFFRKLFLYIKKRKRKKKAMQQLCAIYLCQSCFDFMILGFELQDLIFFFFKRLIARLPEVE